METVRITAESRYGLWGFVSKAVGVMKLVECLGFRV